MTTLKVKIKIIKMTATLRNVIITDFTQVRIENWPDATDV